MIDPQRGPIKADRLEEAIEARDRLKQVVTFLSFIVDQSWTGDVDLKIGAYECRTSNASRVELIALLQTERTQLRNTLEILGVEDFL